MADKKYVATHVGLNAEQAKIIDEAAKLFMEQNGVQLTRSQVLAFLAHRYIKGLK